jgi:hypothetical protein
MQKAAHGPLLLAAITLVANPLLATETPFDGPARRHVVPRGSGPIVVDGNLEEVAWRDAWSMESGCEVQPSENVPPPVRTREGPAPSLALR